MAQQTIMDYSLLIIEASRSHSDTHTHTHLAGLLWTSDRPEAENSTSQHTTLTRDRHPCARRDSNRHSQQQTASDPLLKPRGRWDRPKSVIPGRIWQLVYTATKLHISAKK